jgi:hypothetical protein
MVGFIAIEQVDEFAAIADLISAPEPKLMDVILQLAIDYATGTGCSILETSLTQDSVLGRRLLRHGFIGREERGFQVAVSEDDPQAGALCGAMDRNGVRVVRERDRARVRLTGRLIRVFPRAA